MSAVRGSLPARRTRSYRASAICSTACWQRPRPDLRVTPPNSAPPRSIFGVPSNSRRSASMNSRLIFWKLGKNYRTATGSSIMHQLRLATLAWLCRVSRAWKSSVGGPFGELKMSRVCLRVLTYFVEQKLNSAAIWRKAMRVSAWTEALSFMNITGNNAPRPVDSRCFPFRHKQRRNPPPYAHTEALGCHVPR